MFHHKEVIFGAESIAYGGEYRFGQVPQNAVHNTLGADIDILPLKSQYKT